MAIGWNLMKGVFTAVGTKAAAEALQRGWKATTGKTVPDNPSHPQRVSAREGIIFAMLSAGLAAAVRTAMERRAAEVYEKNTGHLPTAVMTDEEKAAQKEAQEYAKKHPVEALEALNAEARQAESADQRRANRVEAAQRRRKR